ncbi:MAG: hypothetical protein A2158_03845 [Chloroflexi bacterium RBG_13_46_14]|nr:MAG: hypothetical protein A2158_03845 [Chloroflexi bacterium RBG_13_46_14]
MKILLEAMNPEAEYQGGTVTGMFATRQSTNPLARRLVSLDGKTIYLVDIGFGGGHKFMQQVKDWFKENMPSVTTIRRRKTGNAFMDDTTDLWDEIKEKGHAALIGVAG